MWQRILIGLPLAAGLVLGEEASGDLSTLSLEDLMKIEVVSAGKKPRRLDETAAAVYVITQEDIRRSGLSSLPEVLRLAPGVSVSRVSGTWWAIGVRGFNSLTTSKLLVMIDGRTIYSPVFAGVFWDMQDTVLEDIDRIEVIRGPAAALWGANAVNGVINVITKRAASTQGSLVSVTAGNDDQLVSRYRFGGSVGKNTHYRVYGSQTRRSQPASPSVGVESDAWGMMQGGFRLDHDFSDATALTVQGDTFRMFGDVPLLLPTLQSVPLGSHGGNLLSRWTHVDRKGGELQIQTYFDYARRNASFVPFNIATIDVDGQYRRRLSERHELQFGANTRVVSDETQAMGVIKFNPPSERYATVGLSALDEITLIPGRLTLTAGLRADRVWLEGWSVQPTGRLLFNLTPKQSVWAAVSRSARVLTRFDADLELKETVPGFGSLPIPLEVLGSRDLRPESAVAYEAGYRAAVSKSVSLDLTVFRNRYSHLLNSRSTPVFSPFGRPVKVVSQNTNMMGADSHGGEAVITADLSSRSRVSGSLSSLWVRLGEPGSDWRYDRTSPRYLWQVRSQTDLTRSLQADLSFYTTSALQGTQAFQSSTTSGKVSQRFRFDARLGWRLSESGEFSMGVRDMLTSSAREFVARFGPPPSDVKRDYYVRLAWRF